MEVEMVCIANSYKKGGRCLAGVDLENQCIIRPVNQEGKALYNYQVRCDDGKYIKPLDVVSIELEKRIPSNYQIENYLVANYDVLRKQYTYDFNDLLDYCCDSNGICPSCVFYNDNTKYVTPDEIENTTGVFHSLSIICPENFIIKKVDKGIYGKKIRGQFNFGDKLFDLPITDNVFKDQFYKEEYDCGLYIINDDQVLLTISLGVPLERDGNHYKLIASVIINGDYSIEKYEEDINWDKVFD